MKKTITILGYLFLVLIVVLATTFGALYLIGKKLDKESKAYVDAAVPAIAADWDVEELRKRASPEFDSGLDYDEVGEYFDSLHELGKFEAYQGSTGESTIAISLRYGYEVTADYTATVNFETGTAEIQVLLIKQGGLWQILDFKVSPEAYSEDKNII